MPEKTAARRWFDRAETDLRDARSLLEGAAESVENSAFLAQQAIEKYLKAILVSRREDPPRIHDLVKLVERVEALGIELDEALRTRADELSSYAVAARYPGGQIEVGRNDARRAIHVAELTRDLADRVIAADTG